MCDPARNYDLFSKKRGFSYISPTEHDILGMVDDNSLKTRVIPSKLDSCDRIRWILHAERKNMCVSVRENELLSKKRRFSYISPTEQDILGMIDDNSMKTRVIPSKLTSFDRIRWTLVTSADVYLGFQSSAHCSIQRLSPTINKEPRCGRSKLRPLSADTSRATTSQRIYYDTTKFSSG